ncbi:hypothetical protein N182_21275 [Sinorhizobium sp. GL2]|nr:hypothetical protein N182_21275 [Sinorhizobium sp. GL2]
MTQQADGRQDVPHKSRRRPIRRGGPASGIFQHWRELDDIARKAIRFRQTSLTNERRDEFAASFRIVFDRLEVLDPSVDLRIVGRSDISALLAIPVPFRRLVEIPVFPALIVDPDEAAFHREVGRKGSIEQSLTKFGGHCAIHEIDLLHVASLY